MKRNHRRNNQSDSFPPVERLLIPARTLPEIHRSLDRIGRDLKRMAPRLEYRHA